MNELNAKWLACAIDSEGTTKYGSVLFANTSLDFVNTYTDLLRKEGIHFIVRTHLNESLSGKKKIAYVVDVSRREELLKLLPIIIPYLVIPEKRQYAELFLQRYKESLVNDNRILEEKKLILSKMELSRGYTLYDLVKLTKITDSRLLVRRLNNLRLRGFITSLNKVKNCYGYQMNSWVKVKKFNKEELKIVRGGVKNTN